MVVDAGVLGSPLIKPDVTIEEVVQASGTPIKDLISLEIEGQAIKPMIREVAQKVQELHPLGK